MPGIRKLSSSTNSFTSPDRKTQNKHQQLTALISSPRLRQPEDEAQGRLQEEDREETGRGCSCGCRRGSQARRDTCRRRRRGHQDRDGCCPCPGSRVGWYVHPLDPPFESVIELTFVTAELVVAAAAAPTEAKKEEAPAAGVSSK